MLNYCSANRDPARYAEADEFQLERAERGHLAFGAGPHLCVGAPLARAQMRIAATELLAALPDMRLRGAAPLSGLVGGTLMTITELRVSF